MSRAFRAIWQGQFRTAVAYNPRSLALFGCMVMACAAIGLLWLPSNGNSR
jgi:hypothetical protein